MLYVTDMDRTQITKHKTYRDAKDEAICRIGNGKIIKNFAGFYEMYTIEHGTVYIIKHGTIATGFDDIFE